MTIGGYNPCVWVINARRFRAAMLLRIGVLLCKRVRAVEMNMAGSVMVRWGTGLNAGGSEMPGTTSSLRSGSRGQ